MLRVNLVEQTELRIRDMILKKEYNQHNYLPSEGELSERFGVSRATVREAVRSLEVRGFLRREHGKGLLVLDNSVQTMTTFIEDMMCMNYSDMAELLEVRGIIEVEAARLAAQRARPDDINRLAKNVDIMETATEMDDAYYDADRDFHIDLVNASHSNLLATFAKSYTPLLKNTVVVSSQSDYVIEDRHHYHRNIFDFIAGNKPREAAQAMRTHLAASVEGFQRFSSRRVEKKRKKK